MLKTAVLFFSGICLLLTFPSEARTFKELQMSYPRVRKAYHKKEEQIKKLFKKKNLSYPPQKLFFQAFKGEREFEVWVFEKDKYKLFQTYPICRVPGDYGPKRKQGDFQVPEGFYRINRFNPTSVSHLSLGIDYPNVSDKILGNNRRMGGDIFIHGGCGSRGCLPLTDDKMEEIYLLAVEARNQGQWQIPIHIYPIHLNKTGLRFLERHHKEEKRLIRFWQNIQKGYDLFQKNRQLLPIVVDALGSYIYDISG